MKAALLLAFLAGAAAAQPQLEEISIPAKAEKRGSQRLNKDRLIILEEGRDERWNALVEDGREIKRVKRLNKGRPWRVMKGSSPKEDAAWIPEHSVAYGMLKLEATGYDPGPESNGKGNEAITVTGSRAKFGVAAVDPRLIPLKTLMYVEGYGTARAMDIGGAIKGKRIDLCFNTTREADAWGRRKNTRVWLLRTAKKAEIDAVMRALSASAKR